MSDPEYTCLYCNKSLSAKHVVGHMIRNHKDSLAVEKNAFSFGVGINRKIPVTLKIKIGGQEEIVRACFGCLKCWKRKTLSDAHSSECKNKDKHVEVCRSLIPEAHNLTTILQQDGDSSEAILKMKSIIANLQMSKESLERELQKVRKEMAEMEEEHDEESKKLFDVSQAIATILPPTLRCKIADYCNKHIRKHKSYDKENEESEEDEDYDFSHSILLTDSNYDYKYEDYINKKNEK